MAHDVVAEVLTLTVNARTYAGSCSALRRAQGTPSQAAVNRVSNTNVRRSTWIISALVLAVIGLAIPGPHLREVPLPPPALALTPGVPAGAELGSVMSHLDAAISPDERHMSLSPLAAA